MVHLKKAAKPGDMSWMTILIARNDPPQKSVVRIKKKMCIGCMFKSLVAGRWSLVASR